MMIGEHRFVVHLWQNERIWPAKTKTCQMRLVEIHGAILANVVLCGIKRRNDNWIFFVIILNLFIFDGIL